MLTEIHSKLPMRNKRVTKDYYLNQLGFQIFGDREYDNYLMVYKDKIQIHFFLFAGLDPKENYGQIYIRTNDIDNLYRTLLNNKVAIHPNAPLEIKPWESGNFHF